MTLCWSRERLGVASQTTPVHLHEVYQVLEQLSSKYKDMPFDGKNVDYKIFRQYMLDEENPKHGLKLKSKSVSNLSDKKPEMLGQKSSLCPRGSPRSLPRI